MAYRFVSFPMTLDDLKVIRLMQDGGAGAEP